MPLSFLHHCDTRARFRASILCTKQPTRPSVEPPGRLHVISSFKGHPSCSGRQVIDTTSSVLFPERNGVRSSESRFTNIYSQSLRNVNTHLALPLIHQLPFPVLSHPPPVPPVSCPPFRLVEVSNKGLPEPPRALLLSQEVLKPLERIPLLQDAAQVRLKRAQLGTQASGFRPCLPAETELSGWARGV